MGPPGHIAVAFAAKPVVPRASLWVLIVTTEKLDLLCFGFLAASIERTGPGQFPWSHGLFMSVVWSAAGGVIAYLFYKDRRTSLAIGLLIFSHWVLDFIAHSGDLPLLFSRSPLVGLGLESSLVLGLVMESGMLAVGPAIYLLARKRSVRLGT